MTLLPIVERELRVAARRRITWWSRIGAAGFGLLVFGMLQLLVLSSGAGPGLGPTEFAILKWMAFVFAATAGIFLTADAVSEEKREGTLGLLFLTDLHGYDVVLGKLLSHSLRGFYALLAAFPILALPLLAGGLTIREFALSLLVIINTLFFSLSLGLLVSTVSRDYTKALSGAVLVSLIFLLAFVGWDMTAATMAKRSFEPVASLASPTWLFAEADAYPPPEFWTGLALQHGLAWVFLGLASVLSPRVWQEKARASGGSNFAFSRHWRFGGRRFRAALRRRWMDTGPMHWLALRDRWLPRLVGLLTLLVVGLQGAVIASGFYQYYIGGAASSDTATAVAATALRYVFSIVLTLWVAAKASQIFIDSVRNGALELLLVTPVTPGAIVRGQWNALCRAFLFPAACVVALQLATGVLSLLESNQTVRVTSTTTVMTVSGPGVGTNGSVTVTNAAPAAGTAAAASAAAVSGDYQTYEIVTIALSAMVFLAGLASVAWFGMWMGLSNRRISVAVLKTVGFVYVLPWIGYGFLYGLTVSLYAFTAIRLTGTGGGGAAIRSPYTMLLAGAIIGAIFNLAKDVLFIVWARGRLLSRFRDVVAGEDKSHRRLRIPPVPAKIPPLPAAN